MHLLSGVAKRAIKNHTWLVRTSVDIETKAEDFRLLRDLPTIERLLKAGGKVVLLGHRGRPQGKPDKKASLRIVIPFFKEQLGVAPIFLNSFDFEHLARVIAHSPHQLFLLENLRFNKGEEENNAQFAFGLSKLGDRYVNDDFAGAHRKHASIFALPKLLPHYVGLNLEAEIVALKHALTRPRKSLVVVVGGAKVPEKLEFAKSLAPHAKAVLIGGLVANTLLKARGVDIGSSPYDADMLECAQEVAAMPNVILPEDFVLNDGKIRDIGAQAVKEFNQHIATAKTVIWSGAMGLFEEPAFAAGSEAITRAIARVRGFTLAGGGETTYLIRMLKLEKKFDFLSTGGGAMLEFLSGKKLPGLEALN